MNPEQLQTKIARIVSDLQYIQASQVFQCILDTSVVHPELEALSQNTLDSAVLLKLRLNQALKVLDALNEEDLEEAA